MDCPFFIDNIPALSTGRGEILQPVSLNLDGFYLLIVKPEIHVSTAAAFTGIKPAERENSVAEFISLPLKDWKNNLHNDFEKTVFDLYPEIEDLKFSMYRNGAVYSAMSGSGSAVFGLFAEKPVQMDFPGCEVFMTLLGSHF
jgi:4-diphosphocytidyl-2-C-methyl-D-erythritol kinase